MIMGQQDYGWVTNTNTPDILDPGPLQSPTYQLAQVRHFTASSQKVVVTVKHCVPKALKPQCFPFTGSWFLAFCVIRFVLNRMSVS